MKGFISRTFFYLRQRPSLSTKFPPVENGVTMLSSVTNAPFPSHCQKILREYAKRHMFTSKYWITRPQAHRSSNANALPTESPVPIHLQVEAVIPITSLPRLTQQRIVDEYPPFLGSGVGILSERRKWKAVTAGRLIQLLNPSEEDRALFIDVIIAKELGIKYKRQDVIDIRPASSVFVFNAEQLDDPYKGEPQKGVALDAITGKRLGQPAHDILLGVGILRGYTSPMWIAERQLKYINLELKTHAHKEAVVAPNMTGFIVPLSVLPAPCRDDLLAELTRSCPDAFGFDIFFIYNVNGWESTRSSVLVNHMLAINDKKYPFHFVNLTNLYIQKPQYAKMASNFYSKYKPIGVSLLEIPDAGKNVKHHAKTRLAVQCSSGRKPFFFFFAEDATLRRYYNACCMTKPYLTVPSVRSIAILNGKLVGHRDESILRAFALKHTLSSPLWLTESGARRLGVRIHPKHTKHFVTIGAAAGDTDPGEEGMEGFYNVDDFSRPEEILSLFPKTSKRVHFMLDSKWRPVLGKQHQTFLTSLRRRTPLWISVNECLMSGFEPNQDATLYKFPTRNRKEATGTKLYNSQHTTDPVRVIGLSTMLIRPQGISLQHSAL
ncbi:unnamed protein product [Phytomonas sp. EM1]|nr:unnamed protein product [Phytomonas sp. EM1]|eukprot:CCW60350.1 unnamed protein product [Phytomonas sp. isolate EM1]